ncbi:MAG: VWA domain-containing protein [Anaerolineaceae bacterium]|nr:VWA domain-containing protein [Anaerolineaceae bacterium]
MKRMVAALACVVGMLVAVPLVAADGTATPDPGTTPAETPAARPADSWLSPAPGVPPAPPPAAKPDKAEPKKPLRFSQTPKVIEGFLRLYLQIYDKHLKSKDWIARSMAVIGLAMIDDPRTTNKLMAVMEEDKTPIVQLYAWEALHGRQSRLAPQQRALWKRRGFEFAKKNLLRGDLRLGLVGLVEEGGPTPRNKKRIKHIFETTNSINPGDIRTLWALGDTIKRWQSGDLVRWLIERMSVLDDAYRAELVLRRLTTEDVKYHNSLRMESSKVMWDTTRRRWAKWYKEQTFQEVDPAEYPPYKGRSEIMPPGEKITDTADPKWRRDLEMPRFHLDQLDVGLALDTTGSMGRPLEWIKRDVVKMMRAFELISREPRIGVTLYRDQGDEYVTRNIPLTASAADLQTRLAPERPKGGGDIPEAVYEALVAMVMHQKWSPSTKARKVVVIMTDAPPKENSLGKIEKLVTAAAERGVTFHVIKVRTSKYVERRLKLPNYDKKLTTLDKIAHWGNGTSEWVEFWTQSQLDPRWKGTARPTEGNMAERVILRQVLRAALNDSYRRRVDPFIGLLLEYVEEPLKETRKPFPKAPPSSPGGPPRDPQMNR